MLSLPPSDIPLNRHSLTILESWLTQLGAERYRDDPCKWALKRSNLSIEILMDKDDLKVTWEKEGQISQCCFSYGLSREDVEAVIIAGPLS